MPPTFQEDVAVEKEDGRNVAFKYVAVEKEYVAVKKEIQKHGLAPERQAEEHHRSEAEQNHSESLFELLALQRMQQKRLRLTRVDRPPLARIQEALKAQAPLHMYEMDLLAQRHSSDEDVAEMVAKLRTRPSALYAFR